MPFSFASFSNCVFNWGSSSMVILCFFRLGFVISSDSLSSSVSEKNSVLSCSDQKSNSSSSFLNLVNCSLGFFITYLFLFVVVFFFLCHISRTDNSGNIFALSLFYDKDYEQMAAWISLPI